LFGALAAAMPAGAATTASVSPYWVEGHHAFTLALTGETQVCAPEFSHQEAALIGGELVLSVLQQATPGFMCTNSTSSSPYRVEFTAPGLDSGQYPVKVRWRTACEFESNPAPCPVLGVLQDAGTLRVTDSAGLSYHIGPRVVTAGRASNLLLHGPFGCSDKISGVSIDTARPSIYLNMTVEHPAIQCDTTVAGIGFALPPLSAGVWQVYAAAAPYCPPGSICPLYRLAPQLAGALEVKASVLSTQAPARGPRSLPVGIGRAGFRADWFGAPRDAAGRREK